MNASVTVLKCCLVFVLVSCTVTQPQKVAEAPVTLPTQNIPPPATNEPAPEEVSAYHFGPSPNEEELIAALQQWGNGNLRDPYSAKFELVEGPRKGWGTQYGSPTPTYIGWRFKANLNSKNGFGAYTGVQNHDFILSNGKVVKLSFAGNAYGMTFVMPGEGGFY